MDVSGFIYPIATVDEVIAEIETRSSPRSRIRTVRFFVSASSRWGCVRSVSLRRVSGSCGGAAGWSGNATG